LRDEPFSHSRPHLAVHRRRAASLARRHPQGLGCRTPPGLASSGSSAEGRTPRPLPRSPHGAAGRRGAWSDASRSGRGLVATAAGRIPSPLHPSDHPGRGEDMRRAPLHQAAQRQKLPGARLPRRRSPRRLR